MPGGRGGRRKGTPGKGYSNRTDLAVDYGPSAPGDSPGSGPAPARSPVNAPAAPAAPIYPEDLPKLTDPSGRPGEPVTTGLNVGPGADKSLFPLQPTDPSMDAIRTAYRLNPTPELANVMRLMAARQGRV